MMMYLKKLSLIGLLAVTSGFGGQIQIGGSTGLTANYINNNCPVANCLNATAPDGAVSASSTNAALIGYTNTLFAGVSPTPNVGSGPLTDSSTQTLAAVGQSVSFNLINDGNSNHNAWQMEGGQAPGGNQTVEVPIDLSGISGVFLMLNDANGVAAAKDALVTFDFASTPNATTGLTSLTVKLLDSNNSATAAGVFQNAIACTSGSSCPENGSSPEDNGPTLTGPVTTLVQNLATSAGLNTAGSSVTGDVSVVTNQLFSSPYSDGTTGNAVLDDLGFVFSSSFLSTVAGDYLVDVRVYDNNSTQNSWDALSAITVVTPEPSTWLLLLAGVSGFVVYKLRRSARHSA
jgi:hypothetical protein